MCYVEGSRGGDYVIDLVWGGETVDSESFSVEDPDNCRIISHFVDFTLDIDGAQATE